VAEEQSRTLPQSRGVRAKVIAFYAAAAGFGYWLGTSGVVGAFVGRERGTPLARVGFALREARPAGTPADYAALRGDLAAVRAPLQREVRGVFDLVVALRGLENGGRADFAEAERLCRALEWRRCDQPALEVLRKRSRP
jgi:hypothetical protein